MDASPRQHRLRCSVPGCARFAARGTGGDAPFCSAHRRAQRDRDQESRSGICTSLSPETSEPQNLATEFAARLERGNYRGLFGPALGQVMVQAATARGLEDEIGALRVALARVLVEERDAAKLALSVARIVATSVAAARARRLFGGHLAESLTDAVTQVLLELDQTKP